MSNSLKEKIVALKYNLDGKTYDILVKESSLSYLCENAEKLEPQLRKILPKDVPKDPVYLNFDNNLKKESVAGSSNTPSEATCSSTLSTDPPPATDYDSDAKDTEKTKTTRFEWGIRATRQLLAIIKERKTELDMSMKKKQIWEKIATMISTEVKIEITGDQVRERFYTLKKKYRAFLINSNKTGSGRPKAFLFEKEMEEILRNDPTIEPLVAKGSLDENEDVQELDDATEPATPNKKRKRVSEEMKEYMEERDKKFLQALNDMQNKQSELLQKLIDKL